MRFYLITTIILLAIACNAQVLDGIYVKEHKPPPKEINVFPYPIPLQYVFSDSAQFRQEFVTSLAKHTKTSYPKIKDHILVDFGIKSLLNNASKDSITSFLNFFGYQFSIDLMQYNIESVFPSAFKYQTIKAGNCTFMNKEAMQLYCKAQIDEYLQPFYIKQNEVTNKEYREFMYWVRDSIIRKGLVEESRNPSEWGKMQLVSGKEVYYINWEKKLDFKDPNIKPIIERLMFENTNRYYLRKEFDTRKFIYQFQNGNHKGETVAICPDTTVWVSVFSTTWRDPKILMYYWHPAFEDYPVVGVNRAQIAAFLEWKTWMHNQKLIQHKANYRVNYELPNALQWDLACAQQYTKNYSYQDYFLHYADHSYLFDLYIPTTEASFSHKNSDSIPRTNYINVYNQNTFLNGYYFPHSPHVNTNLAKPRKSKKDCIYGLDGNVSEWTSTVITTGFIRFQRDRWQNHFGHGVPLLEELAAKEEDIYKKTHTGSHLIKGGNFTISNESTANLLNKKCTVDGNTQSPVLGFRYVITIVK